MKKRKKRITVPVIMQMEQSQLMISERTQRILLVNIQRDIWKHAVKKQIFRLWEQREYVIKND